MPLPQTFSALGDPIRFHLVERLLQDGELSVGDLCSTVSISAPAISRHLKILREAGIVERRVQKQHRFYRVEPDAVKRIHGWTLSYREFWQGSLDRLENALKDYEADT